MDGARRTGWTIAAGCAAWAASAACYDFHYEAPPDGGIAGDADGASDADGAAGVDGSGPAEPRCVPGGYYCGGEKLEGEPDTLYRCNGEAPPTLMAKCANGCVIAPAGRDDSCAPPSPCVVGGTYCGGDKINGDPDVLYRCGSGGAITVVERCENGCRVNPPGYDDDCA